MNNRNDDDPPTSEEQFIRVLKAIGFIFIGLLVGIFASYTVMSNGIEFGLLTAIAFFGPIFIMGLIGFFLFKPRKK